MYLFYTTFVEGQKAWLKDEEARHCLKTLRMKEGDDLQWVDGQGNWYDGTITSTSRNECGLAVKTVQSEFGKRPFKIHLAVAPTKNMDRFEWMLEKATEFGIDEVTPILCHRSERKHIRHDRLQRIIVAAMKQSLKAYLPTLHPIVPLEQFLKQNQQSPCYIAHCMEGEKQHLKSVYTSKQSAAVLIGPEGDFTEKELKLSLTSGYQPVSLGTSRLRTETAAMAACHILNLLNE